MFRLSAEPNRWDRPIDDPEYLRQRLNVGGQQEPQRKRHRQNPLANRLRRQHPVREGRRTVRHPPRSAGGTKAAALATERNEPGPDAVGANLGELPGFVITS